MVNQSGMCDFDGGRSFVEVTEEDRKHFGTLKEGRLEVSAGSNQVSFKCASNGRNYRVEYIGPMDSIVENNVSAPLDFFEGIIGKVARKHNCNAYERGAYSDINGGAIRTTPFRVYRIAVSS